MGSILLVTDELELPYYRPPLKEYLRGEIGAEGVYGKGGVYVRRRPWYEEQRIEVLRGVGPARDTRTQRVQFANGHTCHYCMLLLTTGGRARRQGMPGMDLPGVHVLRTLAESTTLRALFNAPGKRVVAVGSGFIRLETAASALMKGAQVTIVDPLPRVWPQVVPPRVSVYLQGQFTRHGATLRQAGQRLPPMAQSSLHLEGG